MSIPPHYGSLGRLVGPTLGWRLIGKCSYLWGQWAAPLGLPLPLGERGGHHHNYYRGLSPNHKFSVSTEPEFPKFLLWL
jgi:hypothetical protein